MGCGGALVRNPKQEVRVDRTDMELVEFLGWSSNALQDHAYVCLTGTTANTPDSNPCTCNARSVYLHCNKSIVACAGDPHASSCVPVLACVSQTST